MNRQEHLLVILMEECNELSQEVSKALRFGVHEQRDLPTSNIERMNMEFNDLLGVLALLKSEEILITSDAKRIANKITKIEHYLEYSKECGTLTNKPIG